MKAAADFACSSAEVLDAGRGRDRIGQAHRLGADGLRGVAAIAVVLHHSHMAMPRSYLVVDFFFCLSGFVIAQAYEGRFADGLNFRTYIRLRLVRLYPMLLLGSFFGLALSGWNPEVAAIANSGHPAFWRALIGQVFLIPFVAPPLFFPFNNAQWSIVYELLANALHAALFRWLRVLVLVAIIAVSAACLAAAARSRPHLSVGVDLESFLPGLARVIFGFCVGILLFRLRDRWEGLVPRIGFLWIALIMMFMFGTASFPAEALGRARGDLLLIVFVIPLLVMLGLNCRADPRFAVPLGKLSYPLYAIHLPLVFVLVAYSGMVEPAVPPEQPTLLKLGGVGFIILLALAVAYGIEEPLARWRKRRVVSQC